MSEEANEFSLPVVKIILLLLLLLLRLFILFLALFFKKLLA